ncbi:class I SAM-dependent methyltransferase [Patescibacteria group bacterium]|nr:class I SAM-dependent methyltransferase [Patescibacteria group bacterium]
MSTNSLKVARLYDSIAKDYGVKIQSKQPTIQLEKFIGFLPRSARVLDVGCASGRDTKAIHDLGFQVVGIDISTKLLEMAKKNYPDLTFIKADALNLPFVKNEFDGIFANAVFHHFLKKDMEKVLRKFNEILTFGGILCISTKTGKGTHAGYDSLAKVKRWFNLLTLSELDRMLSRTGFKKIELYIKKSQSKRIDWNVALYRKL